MIRTNAVLQRRIVSVDDRGASVSDPIGFVDRFAQFLERIVGAEDGQVERVAQVVVGSHFQFIVQIGQLGIVQQFVGVGDVRCHGGCFLLGPDPASLSLQCNPSSRS